MTINASGAGPPPLRFTESKARMAEHARVVAGGVNSFVRAGIAPTPLVFERAEGPWLFDADGNRLIDYYLGMGPMILGHSPPAVVAAVREQVGRGILFAGQGAQEAEAARLVCDMVPCAERVRFGSSGTEMDQAAIRLARAATGRRTIVKFEGHYHGWLDNVHWSNAPGVAEAGPADAPVAVAGGKGQDPAAADGLAICVWNDLARLEARLAKGDVAAVLMEPVMCNSGAIAPLPGYLEGVRASCTRTGTILVFDEVITGFRLGRGGAQARFGVTPDLAVFAKAIANGFPVAALAGRADLMDLFSTGGVIHGGTYNGQCVSMAAAVATLRALTPAVFTEIETRGRQLMRGIDAALREAGIKAQVVGFPAIFHVGFGLDAPARDWRGLAGVDKPRYVAFTTALLRRGVRALERGAWFMSAAHDDATVDATLEAVRGAAREVGRA